MGPMDHPTGKELKRFMKSMGFRFMRDRDVSKGWRDKEYVNVTCWSWLGRWKHRRAYGF